MSGAATPGGTTLRQLIAQVVEQASLHGIERAEIAESCGELYSTFNRQVSVNDTIRFPAECLPALIQITRDPRILEWLVSQTHEQTGLLLIKDRARSARVPADVVDIHCLSAEFANELAQWVAGGRNSGELLKAVDRLAGELAAIRMVVKKGKWQGALPLERRPGSGPLPRSGGEYLKVSKRRFAPQREGAKRGGST